MKIRHCKPTDFQALVPLLRQLWPEKKLSRDSLGKMFEKGRRSRTKRFLCAVEDGQVVGFCSMTLTNHWLEGTIANLDELVVDSHYRGRGLGRGLLDVMIGEARKGGAKSVELHTGFHRKEAHLFYERCSFKKSAFLFSKTLR
jgi:N-acetylglutamate synthase-like GNAT family acetyltransferase